MWPLPRMFITRSPNIGVPKISCEGTSINGLMRELGLARMVVVFTFLLTIMAAYFEASSSIALMASTDNAYNK